MKVPDTSDNMKLCLCPSCPTYKKCKLSGGLFCAKGKAKEKATKEGCVCPKCAVYSKYTLKGSYFCRKPAKLLWLILGLLILLIIVSVVAGILLLGNFSEPPVNDVPMATPTPPVETAPTPTPTPTPAPTPTPTLTPTPESIGTPPPGGSPKE